MSTNKHFKVKIYFSIRRDEFPNPTHHFRLQQWSQSPLFQRKLSLRQQLHLQPILNKFHLPYGINETKLSQSSPKRLPFSGFKPGQAPNKRSILWVPKPKPTEPAMCAMLSTVEQEIRSNLPRGHNRDVFDVYTRQKPFERLLNSLFKVKAKSIKRLMLCKSIRCWVLPKRRRRDNGLQLPQLDY